MKQLLFAAAFLIAVCSEAAAQSDARWVQPYPEIPAYWELVGRLFGDRSALAEDARLKTISDPAILAVGSVEPRSQLGVTAAWFATVTYNGSPENLAQLDDPHLVIKDLTQVRVIRAGTLGLMVDVRTASSSAGHMECIYQWLRSRVFLADGLGRAISTCDKAAFWSSWQRQPARLPFQGTFVVDGSTVLDIAYDPATEDVLASLRTPATPPPAVLQPGFRIR
jgi:hypothetical protein